MSLINTLTHMRQYTPLRGRFFVGTVVDVQDPRKIGRVRAMIPSLWSGIPVDSLPWISQIMPASGVTVFMVPEPGATVCVMFPAECIYCGTYIMSGTTYTVANRLPAWDEDYPNSYGFQDSAGNKLVLNKVKKTLRYDHPSGAMITIAANGDTVVTTPGSLTVEATTKIDIESSGPVTVKGSVIDLNP